MNDNTMNDELKAYDHQVTTTNFILNNPRCLITSDPGTGKTRSVLDAFTQRGGKMLVLAPLSILEAAWADEKWAGIWLGRLASTSSKT